LGLMTIYRLTVEYTQIICEQERKIDGRGSANHSSILNKNTLLINVIQ